MKSENDLLAGGALLLVWSMRGEAHDSVEAMQQGGNLMQITAEFLHPLFEQPFWIIAIIVALGVCHVAWRGLKRWRNLITTTD